MLNKKIDTPHAMQMTGKGDSMAPLIKSGANLILDISPEQTYRAGDIVAFVGYRGNIVAHRILFSALLPSGHQQYLLKGDHNIGTSQYMDAERLLGKVQKIVYPLYNIDLATPLSSFVARLITYSGRITLAHHWFYTVNRITVFCLTLVLISNARRRILKRGKK
jgi:signal peptidase I